MYGNKWLPHGTIGLSNRSNSARWLNWRTRSMYCMPNLQKVLQKFMTVNQSSKSRPKFQQRQGPSKGSRCVYVYIDIFKCICYIVIIVHISTIDWLLLPWYGLLFTSIWIENVFDTGWRRFSTFLKWMPWSVITTRWSCLVWRWLGWPNVANRCQSERLAFRLMTSSYLVR